MNQIIPKPNDLQRENYEEESIPVELICPMLETTSVVHRDSQ